MTPDASRTQPPPDGGRRRIVGIVIAAVVLASAIAIGVALVVSDEGTDSQGPSATSTSMTTSTSITTSTSTVPGAPTSAPTATTPAASGTTASSGTAAPVITQFAVTPAEITCAASDNVVLTAVWATQNATQVTVNESAPKPPIGSEEAALRCTPGVTPQDIVFTLTATGPGGTTSQSVTLHVTIT